MNRRVNMKNVREIIRLIQEGNLSNRQIAQSCRCSPTTVAAIKERYEGTDLPSWPQLALIDDNELECKLYESEPESDDKTDIPYEHIHLELKKKGVTMQLLWQEYKETCPNGLMYSQFCERYRKWRKLQNVSMNQIHKAGEKTFVDWVGPNMEVIDRNTGEVFNAYIFVGTLGASELIYAEATPSMELSHWINCHVHMFEYFQGVTEILIPDNTKTAVKKPSYYEPVLQQAYQEMASHYGTVVIPARVRKPKDKSLGELAVLIIERSIMAKLRNRKFFSYYELNQAIRKELKEINNKPFQKMEGSRRIWYETIDKPALRPLPVSPYEFAEWKKARVNIDYHVEFEGNFYSTPYQLVGQQVDIRITSKVVEVLFKNKRVGLHTRAIKGKRLYITDPSHRHPKHQEQSSWPPERLINWGKSIGDNTGRFIEVLISRKVHPEQAYRACMGVFRLAEKYTKERLEKACARALSCGAISYQNVSTILQNGLDQLPLQEPEKSVPPIIHDNIRGIQYYCSKGGDFKC